MSSKMGLTATFSALIALGFPVVMIWAKGKLHSKKLAASSDNGFCFCVVGMLYITIGSRNSGERNVKLMPFWTYHFFHS